MTKRPEVLQGKTLKRKCNCGSIYIIMNNDEKGNLQEVITVLGKGGTCGKAVNEGYGRLISLLLQNGEKTERIIKSIKGISCMGSSETTPSCMTAIASALESNPNKGESK
jgi:hypothetical protein